MNKNIIIPSEIIENKIFLMRGQKVMIDRDFAELYGVQTKALNQAVKRNINRFPQDFVFVLTKTEKAELVTNCDRFRLFNEKNNMVSQFVIASKASVLNSGKAIEA